MFCLSLDQGEVVSYDFDSITFIYCWSILSDGDNMTGDKDSTGNGAGEENDHIIEVEIEGGFWHGKGEGKRFFSKDTEGNPVTLTKQEFDDMMVAGEVIEVV